MNDSNRRTQTRAFARQDADAHRRRRRRTQTQTHTDAHRRETRRRRRRRCTQTRDKTQTQTHTDARQDADAHRREHSHELSYPRHNHTTNMDNSVFDACSGNSTAVTDGILQPNAGANNTLSETGSSQISGSDLSATSVIPEPAISDVMKVLSVINNKLSVVDSN